MSLLFVWLLASQGNFYGFIVSILKLQGLGNISVVGLALAYSITVILEAILLLWLIYKNLKTFEIFDLLFPFGKVLLASLLMSGLVFLTRNLLADSSFVSLQTTMGVFLQLVLSGIAGSIFYILVSFVLKSSELSAIKKSFFNGNGGMSKKGGKTS